MSNRNTTLRKRFGEMHLPFTIFLAHKLNEGTRKKTVDSYASTFRLLNGAKNFTDADCSITGRV